MTETSPLEMRKGSHSGTRTQCKRIDEGCIEFVLFAAQKPEIRPSVQQCNTVISGCFARQLKIRGISAPSLGKYLREYI